MRGKLFSTTAVMALALATLGCAGSLGTMAQRARSPEEATSFIAEAESQLAKISEYDSRANWVRATFITQDTDWLAAKADAEYTDLAVKYAMGAARFDKTAVDRVTRRKLALLKRGLTLPAPPGAAQELSDLGAKLSTIYSTSKVDLGGKTLSLDDLDDLLRTSRDPKLTKEIWEKWHATAVTMTADFTQVVGLANKGSREIGYKDTGALWRSGYDMDPDAFAAKTDELWGQVKPFYDNLHCFVRARLNKKYGGAVQPATGPIRADLLGNMWAQEWGNIFDIVAPKTASLGYDLTKELERRGYDATKMIKTGENFYTSLGFAALPETFWKRSLITRPRDREVVCHASAWDIDAKDDIRIKMCTRVNSDDFFTVHHELGHNIYQRAYADQTYFFRDGANDGFHEAIGDFAGLNALAPTYLKTVGLIDNVPGPEADIAFLLRMALDKIAFLPFGLLVDKWRWQVFSGAIAPEDYSKAWWDLRTKYQGIVPPGPRPADAFDPGAKYHIANFVPYMRYFLADIYEFQFYRAACRQAGWNGALNRCTVFGNKEVGKRYNAMMSMGSSRPWPEALEAFTGERDIDASAIAEYFAPLNTWLTEQNKGQQCGW
jgi:peptidyl-dipeptidase A